MIKRRRKDHIANLLMEAEITRALSKEFATKSLALLCAYEKRTPRQVALSGAVEGKLEDLRRFVASATAEDGKPLGDDIALFINQPKGVHKLHEKFDMLRLLGYEPPASTRILEAERTYHRIQKFLKTQNRTLKQRNAAGVTWKAIDFAARYHATDENGRVNERLASALKKGIQNRLDKG